MAFGREEFVLTDSMKEQVKKLALENPDEETCGFILSNGTAVACKNSFYNQTLDDRTDEEIPALIKALQIHDIPTSTDPKEVRRLISLKTGITITARDRLAFESEGIAAVWHSHCLESSPGHLTYEDSVEEGVKSDITQSKLQRLPFILYHTKFGEWDMYSPYNLSPYPLQRLISNPRNPQDYARMPYCWNRADCLGIPRAVLWGMFEIDLGIHLQGSRAEYLTEGWSRYIEGFPKAGFEEVLLHDSMRFKAGDCLLMQLPGYKALHHLGVCVDEKTQTMLHALDGRVSEIEPIAKWRRFVRVVFRHKKFK